MIQFNRELESTVKVDRQKQENFFLLTMDFNFVKKDEPKDVCLCHKFNHSSVVRCPGSEYSVKHLSHMPTYSDRKEI